MSLTQKADKKGGAQEGVIAHSLNHDATDKKPGFSACE